MNLTNSFADVQLIVQGLTVLEKYQKIKYYLFVLSFELCNYSFYIFKNDIKWYSIKGV